MRKQLTMWLKKLASFLISEEMILLAAYFFLLFILAFGFDMLFTIWEALVR